MTSVVKVVMKLVFKRVQVPHITLVYFVFGQDWWIGEVVLVHVSIISFHDQYIHDTNLILAPIDLAAHL